MDNAVALVHIYLQLNGYFTVTEYIDRYIQHHLEAGSSAGAKTPFSDC